MKNAKIVDSFSNSLNYEGCLFLQINRIMTAMTIGEGSHTNAIEGLEGLLSPYKDEIYEEDMKKLEDNFLGSKKTLAIARGKQINKLDDDDMGTLVFNLVKGKLDALMKLAARTRFLPELSMQENID